MRVSAVACCLLLLGCGGDQTGDQQPDPKARPTGTPTQLLEHDFGVIPHGESRQHEFRIDLAVLGEPYVPLRVHLDCACGHADLRVRHRDGTERFVDGSGTAQGLPGADEQLILRVVIDSKLKEAVDLPKTQSRGFVVLQQQADTTGASRVSWPLLVRFGIEAPVLLRPFASLDFGRVPLSQRGEVVTTLRGDDQHADMRFLEVVCADPALNVTLEPAAEHVLVRAQVRPQQPGNHRALVVIDTSLPGYRVPLVATWKVIPDLEATPLPKVSFRAVLDREQRTDEIAGQFVLVTDHDVRRVPEFTVHQIVGADGSDLQRHFAVTFEPIPQQPRQQRMSVRYTGGLTAGVRGTIVLTKDGAEGPFLPIELVVFAVKNR